MVRRVNLFLILFTLLIYAINQRIKTQIENETLHWFMNCYFNDILGSITFIAYCNFVFSFRSYHMTSLIQIEGILFLCGLFWEYVTPLFRPTTVSDPFDLLAYLCGGFLYWAGIKLYVYRKHIKQKI